MFEVNYELEKLVKTDASVGEGPMWNIEEQGLSWTDIAPGKIYKYDPDDATNTVKFDGYNDGGFVLNTLGSVHLALVILWKSIDESGFVYVPSLTMAISCG